MIEEQPPASVLSLMKSHQGIFYAQEVFRMQSKSKRLTTRQLTTIAILAAISAVLFMVEIPVVLFYKLDFSNLPVLLGAFAMGPGPATLILLSKSCWGFCTRPLRAWASWRTFSWVLP